MTHPTTGHSRMTVLAMGSPAGLSHRPLYRTALMMLAFVASIVLVAGLSACSSSGSGASGETITVSHVYGESQLPTKPKKVVTLVSPSRSCRGRKASCRLSLKAAPMC